METTQGDTDASDNIPYSIHAEWSGCQSGLGSFVSSFVSGPFSGSGLSGIVCVFFIPFDTKLHFPEQRAGMVTLEWSNV